MNPSQKTPSPYSESLHLTLTELREFLTCYDLAPKRGLSQNFLVDGNIVDKILDTAELCPQQTILEIGPGPGSLTKRLLQRGVKVVAVEKDVAFAKHLNRFQTKDYRLTVHAADILEFPIPNDAKIIGNLPYHITTPILEKIFSRPFQSCTLMVQKELGERLLAKPGSKNYGSLTLFTQFHGSIQKAFVVSPSCFYPQPRVDSMVIHMVNRLPLLEDKDLLFLLIRRAFQQRRKMLRHSLREMIPVSVIQKGLQTMNQRIDARPEMLSLEEWVGFFQYVKNQGLFSP